MSGWRAILFLVAVWAAASSRAHPMVEGRLDVVIAKDKISIDARVSMEELLVADVGNGARPAKEKWLDLIHAHSVYLLKHLQVQADSARLDGKELGQGQVVGEMKDTGLVAYKLAYPLSSPPRTLKIDQNLLREFENWSVSLVVRVRQENQTTWETGLLTSDKTIEYACDWTQVAAAPSSGEQKLGLGPTVRDYLKHGIMHILTGYDHLLFVSALVLAATGFWDLIKVVSAFTLAHTVTLTLAVFDIVRVPEQVVEPMIAASIVFVAVQNIFYPERSRGWTRLGIAFGFGLFHGLGFAGGLKDAMSDMPPATLWAALLAFSFGVELGHQIVVIPLFSTLYAMRHVGVETPRVVFMRKVVKAGSALISIAGTYFLIVALKGWTGGS